eukprot:scaffold184941_cov20-Prasinocladus_malaysianus.AAC.1
MQDQWTWYNCAHPNLTSKRILKSTDIANRASWVDYKPHVATISARWYTYVNHRHHPTKAGHLSIVSRAPQQTPLAALENRDSMSKLADK